MYEYLKIAPEEIEKESFRIITKKLLESGATLKEDEADIIKRVIHTTADFSFKDTLKFSDDAVFKARELIKSGLIDSESGLNALWQMKMSQEKQKKEMLLEHVYV